MICPVYKIRTVFNQFNEIVLALGGQPMTEEEFESVDLRNQRDGLNYSAMEAAYRIWNLNNGNPIDCTPNMKEQTPSILFLNLLDLCGGDRNAAISAKSKLYSKEFRNWFGDWTNPEAEDVSKVVDVNGEPLVVYHHTDNENLSEFSTDFENYFSKVKNGTKKAFFFDQEKTGTLGRKYDLPFYLNIKDITTYNGTKEDLHKAGTSYTEVVNKSAEKNDTDGGLHMHDFDDNGKEHQEIWITHNPNQSKSVFNKDEWSRLNNNFYHKVVEDFGKPFEKSDFADTFGGDVYTRLQNGETVTTQELIEAGITDQNVFHGNLRGLAKILSKHNIPVRMSFDLPLGVYASTIIDENGQSVVVLNGTWVNEVSKRASGQYLLHEVLHAVTANALNSPKTAVERAFLSKTLKVFNSFKEALRNEKWHFLDVFGGMYALTDEHEFVSEFLTNPLARDNFYTLAKEIDVKTDGKFMARFKNFINSIFRLFVNKSVFNTTAEQLKQYSKFMENYLNDQHPILLGLKLTNKELKGLVDSIEHKTLLNDVITNLVNIIHKANKAFLYHNVEIEWSMPGFKRKKFDKDVPIGYKYDSIKNTLLSRINAIQTSILPQDTKRTLIAETKGWLNQLTNPQVSKYEAFGQIMNALGPRIINALDDLDKLSQQAVLNSADVNFQDHDNIGMFESVINDMVAIIKNEAEVDNIVSEFNRLSNDDQIGKLHIQDMQARLENMAGVLSTAKGLIENLATRNAMQKLHGIVSEAGALEGAELLERMVSKDAVLERDITWIEVLFGQADSATNEIVRAVAHMIQKADDAVNEKVLNKAVELLNLYGDLKKGEELSDLYETIDGVRTGNLVRDLNFGKHRLDYDEFMKGLNEKYGLAPNDREGPLNETDNVNWQLERQNWLEKNSELRFTPEYYKAWAKVPRHIKETLDKINGAITGIIEKNQAKDPDGTLHYEKITDPEDWRQLQSLWISKRLMRSEYDRYGKKKTGEELKDALTLKSVYEELYGKLYRLQKTKKQQWSDARNKIIEKAGGQEEYQKFMRGEQSAFNARMLDNWDARNSKWEFKRLNSGKAIIFDEMEQLLGVPKINYGEEYDALKEKAKQLLSPYYDLAGEIAESFIPESVKNLLNNEIYPAMAKIRKLKIKEIPGYATLAQASKRLFDHYITFVDTRYYRDVKQRILQSMDEELGFDDQIYTMMLMDYGHAYEMDGMFYTIPYKWLQTMRAKDRDKYMELVPNSAWIEKEDDERFLNKTWVEQGLDKYQQAFVPKRNDRYDNSAQWNKIKNSTTLKALYDKIVETMREANELQTNRTWTNDYQLPGITAKFRERMKNAVGFKSRMSIIWQWICEKIGYHNDSDQDVKLRDKTTSLDDQTEEGDEIRSQFIRTLGRHADGREYSAIPQYFTRRLDHPENISGALIDIVLSYYKMSVNYSEKSKIKDDCDAMLDFVKKQRFEADSVKKSTKKVKNIFKKKQIEQERIHVVGGDSSETSHVYEQLKNLIDVGLYNKVRMKFDTGWFSLHITLSTIRQLTTALNLGWNKKVAAVGFMTAIHAHLINAVTGKEYGIRNLVNASINVAKHVLNKSIREGAYNNKSNDVLLVLMETFNVAEQLDKKIEDTELSSMKRSDVESIVNQIKRAIYQNHTFAYLSSVDWLTKGQITYAAMDNYKYIDKKIYSRLDIEYMRHDQQKYKELIGKYNSAPSVMSLLKAKDGKLYFEDKDFEKAFRKNFSRMRNKCVKQSQKADGVPTGLQRAAIMQSWIGMMVMIHRQFLPLMMQERWGSRVYDYDTQEYKNGLFKTWLAFIGELAINSWWCGAAGVALSTLALTTNPWVIAGVAATVSTVARGYGKMTNIQTKSLKLIYNERFKDYSNQKKSIQTTENRFAVKQLLLETAIINFMKYAVVMPICAWADDDKDDFILNTIAYWLKATLWEVNGPYNVEELISNIKSPTAATSVLDKVNALLASGNSFALSALSYLSQSEFELKTIGKNSPYEGMYAWLKALIQLSPLHNEWEQDTTLGVRTKRKYLERQMFHEKAGDNINMWKPLENTFE